MSTNTYVSRVLALVVGSLAAAHTSAEIVRFEFTASINRLSEYTAATGTTVDVPSSSFTGQNVSLGNTVTGSFYYDSEAPLSPFYQPPPPVTGSYQLYASFGGTQQSSFTVGSAGPSYASSVEPSAYTLIQVANNASNFSGWDIFSLSNSGPYDPVMFQTMTLNLFDQTASVFETSSIPITLDLTRFSYSNLTGAWLRQSDGDQFRFDATLTTLAATPVPELQTSYLMLAGFAYLFGLLWLRGKATARNLPNVLAGA